MSNWVSPDNEDDPLRDPPGRKQATATELAAHREGTLRTTIVALRAEIAALRKALRDARPFCLGLGEGFADGCAVADRIDTLTKAGATP